MPNCKECSTGFNLSDEDRQFYARINVPEPARCPDCRQQRRLAFWPYGILQKRKCDFSGESIISTYPPGTRFPVYKREHWFSDEWDPPEMEIDWNRSFFDQFYALQSKTPHFHQLGKNNINCDYTDDVWDCKNCYLSRSIASNEDLYYVYRILYSKDSMDITYCYNMEQCYECTYCFRCFNVAFSDYCRDCSDSHFLYDCRGCRNCFMCWNLRSKEYHILNQPCSKEEYGTKIQSLRLNSRLFLKKLNEEFQNHVRRDAYHRADQNINVQNCTGNFITNCKNCRDCFLLEDAENNAYVMRAPQTKNCMDVNGTYRGELIYEACQCTDLNNCQFANFSVDCHDCQYIDQCFNSHDCFGCVGLKRREYCILNKQYSKKKYHELISRLIEKMRADGEYGDFFPYRFAYNGFNLSLAAFYYNETPESIQKKGGFWEAEPKRHVKGIDANTLPDLSDDLSDDWIGKPVFCAKTGKVYSFIKQELDFYREHHLPLPDLYPEERNHKRYSKITPFVSRMIQCPKCNKNCTTYYPESWGYQKILCNDCYHKTVY